MIFLGTWISMIVSTVNGAGTPILVNTYIYLVHGNKYYLQTIFLSTNNIFEAKLMRLDPAKIAGPLETAFQDIVGQSFLLGVSFLIFSATENRI